MVQTVSKKDFERQNVIKLCMNELLNNNDLNS